MYPFLSTCTCGDSHSSSRKLAELSQFGQDREFPLTTATQYWESSGKKKRVAEKSRILGSCQKSGVDLRSASWSTLPCIGSVWRRQWKCFWRPTHEHQNQWRVIVQILACPHTDARFPNSAPGATKSLTRSQSVRCLQRAHYSSSEWWCRGCLLKKTWCRSQTWRLDPFPNTPAERRRERTPHRQCYLRKKCTSPSHWTRPLRLERLDRLGLQSHPAHPVINHSIQDDKQVCL